MFRQETLSLLCFYFCTFLCEVCERVQSLAVEYIELVATRTKPRMSCCKCDKLCVTNCVDVMV